MLESKARWDVAACDETVVKELADAASVSLLLARLLVVRGIRTKEQAALFLEGNEQTMHDPYELAGMTEAVARIRKALADGTKIRVYGDYDCDGVSSTALMTGLFRQLGADFDTYIPHRVQEGYGLNRLALEKARDAGVGLIVTVDTGISAAEEVAYARTLGVDVIVTDHHEPPERLPDACAVVNPKQPGCPYPFKHLAGVGVAFKLAQALLGRFPVELLELATIGTIADLMPLTGENRVLVRLGLARMRETGNPGIRALLDVAGADRRTVTATNVAFGLAPRINASGRLESAGDALTLLTTDNEQEAAHLAFQLDGLNKDRQRLVDDMTQEAIAMLERSIAEKSDEADAQERPLGRKRVPEVIVLAQEGWNVGVIGIVASKVLEAYYRPTIILGIDPATGKAKGSARSIAGFDIHRALTACGDLLEHFGGHYSAAGMTLDASRLPELAGRLCRLAGEWLCAEDLTPKLQLDAACDLADATLGAIADMQRLAPFGMGNPAPKFVFAGVGVREMRKMGRDQQHLKLLIAPEAGDAPALEAVAFGKAELARKLSPTAQLDVVGELTVNEWNGVSRPQLMLQDVRVRRKQLFDWRGAKDVPKRLAALLGDDRFEGGSVGVLLFAAGDATLLGEPSPGEPAPAVWLAERVQADAGIDGTPQVTPAYAMKPLNDIAKRAGYAAVKDLLVLTLPQRMEQLQAALRQATGAQRVYALLADAEPAAAGVIPSRDSFKLVYGTLHALTGTNGALARPPGAGSGADWPAYISRRTQVPAATVRFILDVFEELQLVERSGAAYRCVSAAVKQELASSSLYERRLYRQQVDQELVYSTVQELSEALLPLLGATSGTTGTKESQSKLEEVI
ncbi:MAG: single-stranded-DNA-specific exonuclease RecJ [Paenibacillaceae bacterium]|nr:single-stranded-DNA-specific exonuclease RecJ [Paenibacillaceae bacterium]